VGGDFQNYDWPMWGFSQSRGYYQFSNGATTQTATKDGTGAALASYLLGLPIVKQAQLGVPDMQLTQWHADGFVQDDWRVAQNTTVNVGLRYEYMSALTDIRPDKPGSNLTWRDGVPYIFVAGREGTPKGLFYTPKVRFAPRVGLTHSFQGKVPLRQRGGGRRLRQRRVRGFLRHEYGNQQLSVSQQSGRHFHGGGPAATHGRCSHRPVH
jgi:outer membrane receptor protein involved in Fe transport